MWCNPNGINALSINPNTNDPQNAPKDCTNCDIGLMMYVPTAGHVNARTNPKTIPENIAKIGINLGPPKNPNTSGNLASINLLCNHTVTRPEMIPPNTPICKVFSIPNTEAVEPFGNVP